MVYTEHAHEIRYSTQTLYCMSRLLMSENFSNLTPPCDGFTRPEMMFSKVVLPQPEGPSSAYAPPSSNVIFSGSSA